MLVFGSLGGWFTIKKYILLHRNCCKLTRRRFLPIAFAFGSALGKSWRMTLSNYGHAVDRSTSPSHFRLVSLAVLAEDTHQKARSFRSVLSVCIHHSNSIISTLYLFLIFIKQYLFSFYSWVFYTYFLWFLSFLVSK